LTVRGTNIAQLNHYRKNRYYRAVILCRAPLQSKEIFAMRTQENAQRNKDTWQRQTPTHGKEAMHNKEPCTTMVDTNAWQRF
jgi:hypothetical protein